MTPIWLVQVPQQREAPPDLRRRLRAVDPTLELVHVGGDRWWLGYVKPDSARRATGVRLLLKERQKMVPSPDALRQGLLMQQGFGFFAEFTDAQLNESMIRLVQEADWRYRHEASAIEAEMEDHWSGRTAEGLVRRRMLTAAHRNARDITRRIGRRAVTVPSVRYA